MAAIDPGKFNVHFTMQTLTAEDDGAGGTENVEWEDTARFWGELKQSGRGKSFRDTEMVVGYNYRIITHWMPQLQELNERKRLVTDSGKVLYINNIENIEEKNYWAEIYCSKER